MTSRQFPTGYTPRAASDPHVGVRYNLSKTQKERLDSLGIIDLLPNTPNNRYQYAAGSCTGQGFSHAMHYLMKQAHSAGLLGFQPYQPSALAIYAWERLLAGNFYDDAGSTLAHGVRVLETQGIPREDEWPYDEKDLFIRPTPQVGISASMHRLVNSRPLIHDVDEIRHSLSTDAPVVIGIPCYQGFFDAAWDGKVPEPEEGESIQGWHCVVVYKHDPFEHRAYFKNWWPDWGQDCVGSISDDYLVRRSNELISVGAVR